MLTLCPPGLSTIVGVISPVGFRRHCLVMLTDNPFDHRYTLPNLRIAMIKGDSPLTAMNILQSATEPGQRRFFIQLLPRGDTQIGQFLVLG
jgi:hypothetical protein